MISKTIFFTHGSKIHPGMNPLSAYRFLASLLILITTSWSVMAQDGRGIKNEIENTASWTRPNSARKYLNPNISESMREVNQFVRKNRGMKNMPQSKFKVGTTSSRRFVSKPPSNPQVVDSEIRWCRCLSKDHPLFSGADFGRLCPRQLLEHHRHSL